MKKTLLLMTILLTFTVGIYIFNVYDRFNETNLDYYGINNKHFSYHIDSNLICTIEPNKGIANGDKVTLRCQDDTGLLSLNRDYLVDGLLYDDVTNNNFVTSISPITYPNIAYARVNDNGINLLVIKKDGDDYSSYTFENLYYFDDVLYQIENITFKDSYRTRVSPSTTLTGIQAEYLEEYIDLYINTGYQLIN